MAFFANRGLRPDELLDLLQAYGPVQISLTAEGGIAIAGNNVPVQPSRQQERELSRLSAYIDHQLHGGLLWADSSSA